MDEETKELISIEIKRLSEQLGKSLLTCKDIKKITGLSYTTVQKLMNSGAFPIKEIAHKKTVGLAHFVAWQLKP